MEYMIMRAVAIVAASAGALILLSTCNLLTPSTKPNLSASAGELKLVTKSYRVRGKRYVPMKAEQALRYREEGIASYYEANGSRGSLGERLRRGELYAAHPTLPMPCQVRITNLSNGKSCEARVADRGPFSGRRIIDVSSAVARKLDFYSKGVQRVRVEVVTVGDGPHQLKAELD